VHDESLRLSSHHTPSELHESASSQRPSLSNNAFSLTTPLYSSSNTPVFSCQQENSSPHLRSPVVSSDSHTSSNTQAYSSPFPVTAPITFATSYPVTSSVND
jgi:hypothetical protein